MGAYAMSTEELRDLLDRKRPVMVLDVRPSDDRREWSIPGSVHIDAYGALRAGDAGALAGVELPGPGTPVVTVCGEGKTSLIAADQLAARGVEAYSLEGGMRAWSLAWNTAEVLLPGSEARLIQVRRTGKGCLSYMILSDGEAAVIDPSADPRVYVQMANEHSCKITHVLDTHVHADHLSRSRLLAANAGARLFLPRQERVGYEYIPLDDGDVLHIGRATLRTVRTPGHTPESSCYFLEEQAIFTGDTLFLTSVGRPDLKASPKEAMARAGALYHSLKKLFALPPATLVLPGHTSEPVPFDHKPLASTLSEIRAQIAVLGLPEDAFVETVLSRVPSDPPNHQLIVGLNEAGVLPDGDLTYLEAGANRCAIA